MKRWIILTTILLCIPLGARAEELPLTLEEAVDLALRDNRSVLLQAEEVKKAQEKVAEARGGFLPSITGTATQSRTRGYYDKDVTQTTAQATLKQYLYKGGKTVNTFKQNKFKLAASKAGFQKTQQQVTLEVKKAFYTLLLADAFVDVNKNILNNTENHLKYLEVLYQNGRASALDVLKVKEAFSSVSDGYQESLHQTEALQSLLCNLLYLAEGTVVKPNAAFTYEPKTLEYEEGYLKAMADRPEIHEYADLEKASQMAVEVARADNRPGIYASWDYYSRSHLAATNVADWNDNNVIGLTISWPIFDGWATKAKVEQAISDLKEAQLNKEKVIKDIAVELKNAYLDFKNAINQVKTAEADTSFYENNYLMVKQKYEKGLLSALDLDDARVSREVSLFNKNQAVYNYTIAQSEFEKAIGGK